MPPPPPFAQDFLDRRDVVQEYTDTVEIDVLSSLVAAHDKHLRDPATNRIKNKKLKDAMTRYDVATDAYQNLVDRAKTLHQPGYSDFASEAMLTRGTYNLGLGDFLGFYNKAKEKAKPQLFFQAYEEEKLKELSTDLIQSAVGLIQPTQQNITDLLTYTGMKRRITPDKLEDSGRMAYLIGMNEQHGKHISDEILRKGHLL